MSSEHLGPFLTSAGVAAELTANGKRCSERTAIEWARRWPGISIKIGGSRLFPQRVVTLLLAGIHFSEIPARLRDINKYSADQPTGRRPARRQLTGRRVSRARR